MCVCATYSLLGTPAYMLYWYVVCVKSNSVLLVADGGTSSAMSPTWRGAHEKTYGMRNLRRNVYAFLEVWMLWLGCLSITTVHGACDRPRYLCVVNSGIHAPHLLDLRGVIIKPPKPPILLNLSLKTIGLKSAIPLAIAAAFLAEINMYLSPSSVIGQM